ncbi:hypothetical protein M569_13441, partial [Genlisea aurea]
LLCDPLYLSYFVFFSPYILKLIVFLSPVLFTTSLLLLILKTSDLGRISAGLIEGSSKEAEERIDGEEFFEIEVEELMGFSETAGKRGSSENGGEQRVVMVDPVSENQTVEKTGNDEEEEEEEEEEEDRKVNFLKILNSFEKMTTRTRRPESAGENPRTPPFPATVKITNHRASSAYVKTQSDSSSTVSLMRARSYNHISYEKESAEKTDGEEQEGKKLSEEIMDSLWGEEEAFEEEKKKPAAEEEEEEEEEEEAPVNGSELCCLLALRLSTGKVNRGMGRRNFAGISNVVKGFRWLSHVSKNRKSI